MKATVCLTNPQACDVPYSDGALMVNLLKNQRIKHETVCDLAFVMRTTKGKCNPANGVIVLFDSYVCTDVFQLAKAIEELGIKLI